MKTGTRPVHRIELRLKELGQLFNSMDPTPFHHRDLDQDAEEFIESWALEFPPDSRLQINIHLQQMPADANSGELVTEAIHNFFEYKAEITRRELVQLMVQGRISLLIGVAFLASCLIAANAMGGFFSGTFLSIGRESLTIAGWVAMWRPIQIFLYDWWPLARRRRILRNLSEAHVRVLQGG